MTRNGPQRHDKGQKIHRNKGYRFQQAPLEQRVLHTQENHLRMFNATQKEI